ncbi:Putative flippase GtrA (transmembrane translocase of bactoprenol-linked glucose) [Micromonospora chaiyaphumensis]|uniref:Putative flippase GtrA (Transmembrane translocase of bactoprenol-linked glucose) n=2 Tax=Micromonospora chaiyaphumensis TaxID=307119 RepID=A0A1C4WDE8_9ACTN|nr:Putative flippase GtrA (transmembrane translocase of bactoprenol-linked glucose) [Micromonospora chaiyaphumensis]
MPKFDTATPVSTVRTRRTVVSRQMAGVVRLTATSAGCLPQRRWQAGRRRHCAGSTAPSMLKPLRRRCARVREGEQVTSLLPPKPPEASQARPVDRSTSGSFARFVLIGGGVGLASSIAVSVVGTLMPWAAANALITVISTLLGTELHARFTFGAGRRARWHQHLQSAGSATAAYLVTSAAVLILHAVQPSAGIRWEQAVYLSASALAGTGRFLVLRLYVFAHGVPPASTSLVCGRYVSAAHRAVFDPVGGELPLTTSDWRRSERRWQAGVTALARPPRRPHPAAGVGLRTAASGCHRRAQSSLAAPRRRPPARAKRASAYRATSSPRTKAP